MLVLSSLVFKIERRPNRDARPAHGWTQRLFTARAGELRDGVLELIDRYGAEIFTESMRQATEASEARLREKLRELPDGTVEAVYFIDDDGVKDEPIKKIELKSGQVKAVYYRIQVKGLGHRKLTIYAWGKDEKARDAVRRWRFEPARRAGISVTASLEVPVTFRLIDRR